MKGIVYVARRERDGIIKIGYTDGNPKSRIQQHGLAHQSAMTAIGLFPSDDAFADEQRLLMMFAKNRVEGNEWFRLSDADIETIAIALKAPANWRDITTYRYMPTGKKRKVECLRCGLVWQTALDHPKRCWLCRCSDWDKPITLKCGHAFKVTGKAGQLPRPKLPVTCAKCRSPYWEFPRTRQRKEK